MACEASGLKNNRGITIVISNLLLIAVVVAAVAGFLLFYNAFFKSSQSKVSQDIPSITVVGPSSAKPGDTAVLYLKNTGSVSFANWSVVEGPDLSGVGLNIGDQRTISADLSGSGPWVVHIVACTDGGDVAEDAWVIEES